MGGAVFSNAAIVTALAGNMTSDPTRRVTETGMLLAALAFPGSLVHAGSEAHDSLTRVRLEDLQIRTIFSLVEEIEIDLGGHAARKQLLFVTNKQARLFDFASATGDGRVPRAAAGDQPLPLPCRR